MKTDLHELCKRTWVFASTRLLNISNCKHYVTHHINVWKNAKGSGLRQVFVKVTVIVIDEDAVNILIHPDYLLYHYWLQAM